MSVDLDMAEVSALAANLADAAPKAQRASSESMTKIAAQLRDDIRDASPVLTGETRDSVRVHGTRDLRIVSAGGAAFWLEFGTSDTAPQPFVGPQVPAAARRLEEALEDIDPFD